MMTLGAHEVAIIAIAWLLLILGPVFAQTAIGLVRRYRKRQKQERLSKRRPD